MDKKSMNISVSAWSVVKTILIIGLFVVAYVLRDLVLVVLTAILIASAIEPATRWFGKRRVPRLLAVLIVYLGWGLVLLGAFYFLFVPLLGDTAIFLKALPTNLTDIQVWNPLQEGFLNQPIFANIKEGFSIEQIINQANSVFSGTFNFLGAASSLFGGMLSLILIVVLSFYFSVQENGIVNFLKLVTPIKHEKYVVDLWKRAEIKIGLWVQGQIILAVVIGVLTYLGLMLLGIPNALLLAFLAALLELIPVFGPIIAAVPAVVLGFTSGGLSLAVIVVGLYIIIQQFESQLIYPLVVRKIIGLSPIIVILALIAGFKLAGFLGMLLFVPLSTIMMIFLDDLEKEKLAEHQKLDINQNIN